MAIWFATIVFSIGLLIVAVYALLSGQPYGVWYSLGLPGLLGTFLFSILTPVILNRYREAERRSMSAQDL